MTYYQVECDVKNCPDDNKSLVAVFKPLNYFLIIALWKAYKILKHNHMITSVRINRVELNSINNEIVQV